jgi:5-methylcytosine-specific restriction enzyme B
MPEHLLVVLSWQDNLWTNYPTDDKLAQAPPEFLNFNLERNIADGYKIGYLGVNNRPSLSRFVNGASYVFFYADDYIVGVYGHAEIGDFSLADLPPRHPRVRGNVKASLDQVCRFLDVLSLKADPARHLSGLELGPGFIYITNNAGRNILDDAIDEHRAAPEHLAKLHRLRAKLSRSIWKIAPVEQARHWPICRDKGMIHIGWDEINNFHQYWSRNEIKEALRVEPGQKSNDTDTVWYFAREIRPGDLVVANRGREEIVGVGLITGDYVYNPAGDEYNTDPSYPNYRLVDWKIDEAVRIPLTLPIPTVAPITREQWQQIKRAYLAQNPALKEVLDTMDESLVTPTVTDNLDSELAAIFRRTSNVILYGPPGTGKTYRARQFAETWAQGQRAEADPIARNYWCVIANPRDWHWDNLFEEEVIGYREGKIKRNYEVIQPGDLVFGYLSSPDREVYCIAEVVPEPDDEGWPFYLKGLSKLDNPVPLETLRADPILSNSEPVRHNMQGTLFWFSPEEADQLLELIEAKNPDLLELSDRHPQPTFVRTVTFHQSYGYEDFIEGLRPISDPQGQIRYEWHDGLFKQICEEAADYPDKNFILIIDEINRGNIAKIFGELITLLEDDKRLGGNHPMETILPGTQRPFGVPKNLYIIGTMKTADRSIALLDIALRRRFTFVEVKPEPSLLAGHMVANISLQALLNRLNTRLEILLDRDHCLGHSYLMDVKDLEQLHFVWYNKIIPLLQEYFYNDGERLRAVLDDFIKEDKISSGNIFTHRPEMLDDTLSRYRLVEWKGTDFIDKLKALIGPGS